MALTIGVLIGLVIGGAIGYFIRHRAGLATGSAAEAKARSVLEEAEKEAERARRDAVVAAKDEALRIREEADSEIKGRRAELDRRESRFEQRESHLQAREEDLDRQAISLADRGRLLEEREEALRREREELEGRSRELTARAGDLEHQIERVAAMTSAEAKSVLTKRIEDDAKREAMATVRELETRAREEAEARARRIVTLAIQRLASEQTAESTVAVVSLPSDDMKGRIIGREGRNIRAFESVTGVNIIIDDTPEAVLLSCFDPVRREVGRITLEKLVADGRIHPSRIEEIFDRASGEVEEEIRKAGEAAVLDVGITDMHPDLIRVLGRLQYRTSYGQNVLKHLIETAHIAGVMAAELGLPPDQVRMVKRCGLLHDIGKAVTHEVEGSHALIGAELARRLKEPEPVVHAIESHHGEVEQRTLEAVLAQTADQISGGRPGARRETLENYVKRLEKLEEICTSYPGVEKTFAMQAGREVRVMVKPESLDDLACQVLARDIAKRIEEELQYPGQIKITVVRETRSTEFAK
ncbi:MAG TPA: ribonuclease Y [Actinomycetota bacterium]|nr:ribonuclease Y [Actinomycetota bacterium]